MKRKDERSVKVTCENCKKEHTIKVEDMKLVADCHSYKLYSWECSFCGKKDYVREKIFG